MKKITLNHIQLADKSSIRLSQKAYTICLGNGNIIRLSNKKEAEAILAEINRDLNFYLVMLNTIYIDVYTHYRKLWFYFNNRNGVEQERDLNSNFSYLDRDFELMVTRSHYENGNQFVFKNFFTACEYLETNIKILQAVELARGGYAEIRMLRVILTRIEFLRDELGSMGFGRSTAKNVEGKKVLG